MGNNTQLAGWLMTYTPSQLSQADLALVCEQSSSVGLCKQDYRSRCVAELMTCATMVNTQRDKNKQTASD